MTPDVEPKCLICRFVAQRERVVFESDCWIVFLFPDQAYLGRSVVTAKRHVAALSELAREEWQDRHRAIVIFEQAVRAEFGAEVFNWGCLMNFAFQEEQPRPHVHWHVRPRYREAIIVEGVKFSDDEFGDYYSRDRKQIVPEVILEHIRGRLESRCQELGRRLV